MPLSSVLQAFKTYLSSSSPAVSGRGSIFAKMDSPPTTAGNDVGIARKVRVGLVGAGRMGRLHARHLRQNSGADFIGVVDQDPSLSQALAKKSRTRVFAQASDLLGQTEAVVLAVPTVSHFIVGKLFLEAGVHCLIEKPLAATLPEAEALAYVAGYSLGLDVTLRGSEERSFRKSIDSYAVLGPWLVTKDEIAEPGNVQFRLKLNGQLKQDANTRDMLFGIPRLISLASSFYALYPGDLIFTGAPAGVGQIKAGDVIEAECPGVGAGTIAVR